MHILVTNTVAVSLQLDLTAYPAMQTLGRWKLLQQE
jgi:hypothetical protein